MNQQKYILLVLKIQKLIFEFILLYAFDYELIKKLNSYFVNIFKHYNITRFNLNTYLTDLFIENNKQFYFKIFQKLMFFFRFCLLDLIDFYYSIMRNHNTTPIIGIGCDVNKNG